MKKLMFAAAAAAVTTGAFAVPTVYDYTASVKHLYLKAIMINQKCADGTVFHDDVYQKYQKSASLKGYLIMDADGVTSQVIVADAIANTPGTTAANGNPATGVDFGRSRGFLVVQNSNAEKDVRFPKIIPAVLDAKWIDTAFSKNHAATSGLAEGTLFAGGESVAAVRSQFDDLKTVANPGGAYNTVADNLAGTGYTKALTLGSTLTTDRAARSVEPVYNTNPGMTAYADYVWTSVYLFGKYNGPNMFQTAALQGPFEVFEAAWDKNLPAGLQTAFASWQPFYHDTWMNGAGIGKWEKNSMRVKSNLCCGLMRRANINFSQPVLTQLTGAVKGGVFLCTDNGIAAWDSNYAFFDTWQGGRGAWEDQFVAGRLVGEVADAFLFAGDKWQWDMWLDGSVEQETTDVITGTWSIKIAPNFFTQIYAKQWGKLSAAQKLQVKQAVYPAAATGVEDAIGLEDLFGTIYSAAMYLNKDTLFANGQEIYTMFKTDPEAEKKVPMVTPQFATYYGLANWQ